MLNLAFHLVGRLRECTVGVRFLLGLGWVKIVGDVVDVVSFCGTGILLRERLRLRLRSMLTLGRECLAAR